MKSYALAVRYLKLLSFLLVLSASVASAKLADSDEIAKFQKRVENVEGVAKDFHTVLNLLDKRATSDLIYLENLRIGLEKDSELLKRHEKMAAIHPEAAHQSMIERTGKMISLLSRLVASHQKTLPDCAPQVAILRSHVNEFSSAGIQFKAQIQKNDFQTAQTLFSDLEKQAIQLNKEYELLKKLFVDRKYVEDKMALIDEDLKKLYGDHGVAFPD